MHEDLSVPTGRDQATAKVYGITDAEIVEASNLKTVWARFLSWVEELLEMIVPDEADSESEEIRRRIERGRAC